MSSILYAQRSSAARAAKKACAPYQEFLISELKNGYIFTLVDFDDTPAEVRKAKAEAEAGAFECDLASSPAQTHLLSDEEPVKEVKAIPALYIPGRTAVVAKMLKTSGPLAAKPPKFRPWQLAKVMVVELKAGGLTKKEIMAECLAAGIPLNTADGAYYEMCVKQCK